MLKHLPEAFFTKPVCIIRLGQRSEHSNVCITVAFRQLMELEEVSMPQKGIRIDRVFGAFFADFMVNQRVNTVLQFKNGTAAMMSGNDSFIVHAIYLPKPDRLLYRCV